MNEDKKEELTELLGGWLFLSPFLAYLFKIGSLAYLMFLGLICYIVIMVAIRPKEAPTL